MARRIPAEQNAHEAAMIRMLAAAVILALTLAALNSCRIPNRPLMDPSSEQRTAPTSELGSGLFF